MGYYIRILSPSDRHVPYGELLAALKAEHPAAELTLEQGSDTEWRQLLLRHEDGCEIAVVERNSVHEKLGAAEVNCAVAIPKRRRLRDV